MSALKKFEEKVKARNVSAHETAGQLAQLLMEEEHYESHDYHYLRGLINKPDSWEAAQINWERPSGLTCGGSTRLIQLELVRILQRQALPRLWKPRC